MTDIKLTNLHGTKDRLNLNNKGGKLDNKTQVNLTRGINKTQEEPIRETNRVKIGNR